jgi:hypothetical protein
MKMKFETALLKLLLLTLLAFGGAANARAAGKTWVGGAAGKTNDWNTAANWSPSGVPAAGDDITIATSKQGYPIVTVVVSNSVKNLSINNIGTLTVGSGGSLLVSGITTVDGTLKVSGGTLAIHDLTGTGSAAMSGGTLQINHDFKFSSSQFSSTGGTVEWTGSASAAAFSSGIYQFFNVVINVGANPGFDNQANLFLIAGNWTNNGSATLTRNATTVIFNGGTAQILTGSSLNSFNNLAINNVAGVTLTTTATVNGTLGLFSGTFSTGSNSIVLAAGGSVFGGSTGSYVNGSLQKAFGTGNGQSFTFPVGGTTNYTPVSLASLNVTTAGSLTAKSTPGDHLAISGSGIAPTKSVNRYWTLTNAPSGIVVASYSATFNFVASDVDAGASSTNFIAARYNGSWSIATNGTKTTNSMKITGLTSFGDFSLGEPAGPQCLGACSVRANGVATFKLTGVGGRTYTIQASADMTTWVNIGTATADANGVCQFDDVNAASFSHRFYRAVY